MKVISYGEKLNTPVVIALGYFDAIHVGHKKLFKTAVDNAKRLNATACALIFSGTFKGKGEVFTLDERLSKIENEGVEIVIHANLNSQFASQSKSEFLNVLFSTLNVKGVVTGEDFTFGKNAEGNVNYLTSTCNNYKIEVFTVNAVMGNSGLKISTSDVKTALRNGEIDTCNTLLGDNYYVTGVVLEGKKLGRTIGFPTANIVRSELKFPIKTGVYKTYVILNGKRYGAITNVGAQPTVSGENEVIETYVDNFSGNLYGKVLTVYFEKFLRDIKKFNSVEELKNQLLIDKRSLYD